ncbi:MAG: hypothetical protein MJ058_09005, partial [Akkermansia sp.]|nr:hypothetical protein [Akkermansia sp.]
MPEDSNTPPPVPASLPPVPSVPPHAAPHSHPHAPVKPQGPSTDPSWWRQGWVPLVVLVMAAVSADLLWPHIAANTFPAMGLGAAIGAAVYIAAVLMLRRDISRNEYIFMIAMG